MQHACLSHRPASSRGRRMRTALAGIAFALSVAAAAPASAGEWPEKTVTVIVPYAAGGNTDIMARLAADWLSSRLGNHFIVENRVGAGATIGAGYVAKAAPDGATFLFGAAPQLLVAPLVQKVSYDARKDFAPAGTPRPILERLAKETALATKDPKIVQRLTELGIEPGGLTLEDFVRDIEESRPAYAEAVQAAGIRRPE